MRSALSASTLAMPKPCARAFTWKETCHWQQGTSSGGSSCMRRSRERRDWRRGACIPAAGGWKAGQSSLRSTRHVHAQVSQCIAYTLQVQECQLARQMLQSMTDVSNVVNHATRASATLSLHHCITNHVCGNLWLVIKHAYAWIGILSSICLETLT